MNNEKISILNKFKNYLNEKLKQRYLKSVLKDLERQNLNSKGMFIYFHNIVDENMKKNKFLTYNIHNDYHIDLTQDDKFEIAIKYSNVKKFINFQSDEENAFEQYMLDNKLNAKDLETMYHLFKNGDSFYKTIMSEKVSNMYINLLPIEILFDNYDELIKNKEGDIVKTLNNISNQNPLFIPFVKKLIADKFLTWEKYVSYANNQKKLISDDILNLKKKEEVINSLLEIESIFDESLNLNKTIMGGFLRDASYNGEKLFMTVLKRMDFVAKSGITEEFLNDNMVYFTTEDGEKFLKKNYTFESNFNLFFVVNRVGLNHFKNNMDYIKSLKNKQLNYVLVNTFLSSFTGDENSLNMLSKELMDSALEYYRSKDFEPSYSNLRLNLTQKKDLVLISGFESYDEMYNYFVDNDLIHELDFLKVFTKFSVSESDINNKLKIKQIFLNYLISNYNRLCKKYYTFNKIAKWDISFLYEDLNVIPNTEEYKNFKEKLFRYFNLNKVFNDLTKIERIIKENENNIKLNGEMSDDDIKNVFINTSHNSSAFMVAFNRLTPEIIKELKLTNKEDLTLICKTLYVNTDIYDLYKNSLINNPMFIDIYFQYIYEIEWDEEESEQINVNVMNSFNKNLMNIDYFKKVIKSENLTKFWSNCFIKENEEALFPYFYSKEYIKEVKNVILEKGICLTALNPEHKFNTILNHEFLNEMFETENGLLTLLSFKKIDKEFINKNIDKFLDKINQFDIGGANKYSFLINALTNQDFSKSKQLNIYKSLSEIDEMLYDDKFVRYINGSVENIISFIDVCIDNNRESLLLEVSKYTQFNGCLFEEFLKNNLFKNIVKKIYGENFSVDEILKDDKLIVKISLISQRNKMVNDIEQLNSQNENDKQISDKPVKKIKVKKF